MSPESFPNRRRVSPRNTKSTQKKCSPFKFPPSMSFWLWNFSLLPQSMAKPRVSKHALNSYTIKAINKTIRRKSSLSPSLYIHSLSSHFFLSLQTSSGWLRADAAVGAVEAVVRGEGGEDRVLLRCTCWEREGARAVVLPAGGVDRRPPPVPWVEGAVPIRPLRCSERRHNRRQVYGPQFQGLHQAWCRRKRRFLLSFWV